MKTFKLLFYGLIVIIVILSIVGILPLPFIISKLTGNSSWSWIYVPILVLPLSYLIGLVMKTIAEDF